MKTTKRLGMQCGLLGMLGLLAVPGAGQAAIVVSDAPSSNIVCSGTVCTPTASAAVLNVAALDQMLVGGNVTIATAGAGGVQAIDIVVKRAPSWASGTTLALDSYRSIRIAGAIAVQGTATLSLTINDGGRNGLLHVPRQGAMSFPGGTGHLVIDNAPYTLVGTLADLATLVAANPAGHFALMADIDASAHGGYSTSPVTTSLTGDFDGLGHVISNLKIVNPIKQGGDYALFTAVAAGGSIENVSMTNVMIDVKGTFANAGGLVGGLSGTLSYVNVTGAIHSKNGNVGGIAAYSGGTIDYASAKTQVHGATVGGIAGANFGTIFGSSAGGEVVSATERDNANAVAGGLVGDVNGGIIEQSFSNANVEIIVQPGTSQSGVLFLGGLVGNLERGTITNSYDWSGNVTLRNYQTPPDVGGLVGIAQSSSSGIRVDHCYAADVIGSHLRSRPGTTGGAFGVAGPGTYRGNYWDTTTTGLSVDSGSNDSGGPTATALTTAQLQSGLPIGFDPEIWAISPDRNGGLPYLRNSVTHN